MTDDNRKDIDVAFQAIGAVLGHWIGREVFLRVLTSECLVTDVGKLEKARCWIDSQAVETDEGFQAWTCLMFHVSGEKFFGWGHQLDEPPIVQHNLVGFSLEGDQYTVALLAADE